MPSSFATDLLGIPSAHRRMARQRSDNDRATRRPRTCRFRYARSSLLRTKAAIGRPTTLPITRPHHIDKSEAYSVMNLLQFQMTRVQTHNQYLTAAAMQTAARTFTALR